MRLTRRCADRADEVSRTLRAKPGGSRCFEKALPGNVLYAHAGAFVGFSENALQLGSQWAQLQLSSGQHLDPPADTQMINFGFNLPTPLTRAGFCSALQSSKGKLCYHTPARTGRPRGSVSQTREARDHRRADMNGL